jgi:S-disulfanyl-L-cysteine oxidoreductase SoxD
MSSCLELRIRRGIGAAALLLAAGSALAQVIPTPASLSGIGRPATAKELAAWDIDVRPDFKGLPKGSGSVASGTEVWEAKCASCHGIFGESNEVFSPLVGGTTKADVKTGRVARLTDDGFPGRTTLMKVPTLSTLWDYINRAMPWNTPKSLNPDEVYGVVAYLLNLGGVVPDNFTLSNQNMADVQKLLPNRNGMSTNHGLWPGRGMGNGRRPDVRAVACMKDCATEPTVKSFLPDHARNAHGNLAEQNRLVGAQHGADTTVPAGAARAAPAAPAAKPSGVGADASTIFKRSACNACHNVDTKLVGPGLREIAKKHAGRPDLIDYLSGKIVAGGTGVWGQIPMPAQALSPDDAKTIARWIADGAK